MTAKIDSFQIARSIQKHVKRLKSFGYSHPPIVDGAASYFRINVNGRVFRVTVAPDDDIPNSGTAFKLIKDGVAWDYSTHRSDCEKWRDKVLREEPDAKTEIVEVSLLEMQVWRD